MTTKPESISASNTTGVGAAAGQLRWGTLLVVLSGVFMATLDFFIVNVAIPSAQADLNASDAAIQLVVAGYGLAYGAGLITGGRLGDLYGRRRLFVLGLVLFTLASAACGLAPTAAFLVAARVVQGASAALMAPQVLAILGVAFTGEARARAFSAYGMTMGLAAVFGQLLGGLLIRADVGGMSWRTCFLINVLIGAVALVLTPRMVPESRAPGRPRLDLAGMVLVTLALVAVVLPLIEGRQQGWPLWAWVSLVAALPLFLAFGAHQRWLSARDRGPLVNPAMFRERAFTFGLLGQLVFWMGQASFFLVFALYVQQGRGLDALEAGLLFVAIGAGYMVTSTNAHHLARRLGRQVLALGGLVMAVGLLLLLFTASQIGTTGHVALLTPGLVIDGAGMGMVVAPLASTVLSRVSPAHVGAASGMLATALQIGNAIGVAIIGLIFYGALARSGGAGAYPDAFMQSVVYLVAIGVTLALLVQLLPRGGGAGK